MFSAIRVKEFNKPPGSILRNNKSEVWKVILSTVSSDCRTCTVTAMLLQEWTNASDEHTQTGIVSTITVPSNDWKIVSMPGSAGKVAITHLEQEIPSSLCQRFPVSVDTRNAIYRLWMASIDSDVEYRILPVQEYADNVRLARRLNELWNAIASPLFDSTSATDASDDFGLLIVTE